MLALHFASSFPSLQTFYEGWKIRQEGTIYEQLALGIRYFDLRLSFTNQQIFVSQLTLLEVLDEFRRFLDENVSEVVTICVKDYEEDDKEFGEEHGTLALKLIQQKLGDLILKPVCVYSLFNLIDLVKTREMRFSEK